MKLNGHEIEGIWRTFYRLDDEGNRIVNENGSYNAENEDFDELHCLTCGEYFDYMSDVEKSGKCRGEEL